MTNITTAVMSNDFFMPVVTFSVSCKKLISSMTNISTAVMSNDFFMPVVTFSVSCKKWIVFDDLQAHNFC